jgi:hypothetical protein
MAHLTHPLSFRAGQTKLWSDKLLNYDNNIIGSSIDPKALQFSTGLKEVSARLLRKERLYMVGGSVLPVLGRPQLNILYYPAVFSLTRKHLFPLYTSQRMLLLKALQLNTNLSQVLFRL